MPEYMHEHSCYLFVSDTGFCCYSATYYLHDIGQNNLDEISVKISR